MFDQPVRTIEQAREFFKAMECSHFHMDREFPERAGEYRLLNISAQIEAEWRAEKFNEYHTGIMEAKGDSLLWNMHSRMYDLFEPMKTGTALIKLLGATRHLRNRIPVRDRVIVAETINGRRMRSARSGLIYAAYDLNHIPAAKGFVELPLHFSTCDEQTNRGVERCQKAMELCQDIRLELGF